MSTLALEYLFDSVSASFAADSINAINVFGWREPSKHPRGNRIAWVPGDPSDVVGPTGPARNPGGVSRSLGTLLELFTVYITAQDPSDPEDERKQYHIARMLRDAWFRAVYKAGYGTFAIRSETWLNALRERRYGAGLRVVCEIQAPILDTLPDAPLVADPLSPYVDALANAIADGTTLSAEIEILLVDTLDGPIPPGAIPPVGGGDDSGGPSSGGVQTVSNKNMPALTTVADGDLATAIAVALRPSFGAFVSVSVNGVIVSDIGNGTRTNVDGYFSNDGGATARPWALIQEGDTFHWQGSHAGYQLAAGDLIDFWYED